MSRFRFRELKLENYRCFESLALSLEQDVTVLFAENGGGKSSILTALAMGLAVFQRGAPKSLKLDPRRDARMKAEGDGIRREPAGPTKASWMAMVGATENAEWSTTGHPGSGRTKRVDSPILEAIEKLLVPGERWPLFAWYGVDRLERSAGRLRKATPTRDRWEGYASSLDPDLDEAPLLQWLQDEMLGDVVRRQQEQPERFFHKAVMEATVRATPGVTNAWYDPVEQSPKVQFEGGRVATWSELSDGYHVFIALVADIARRAVMLNEMDGGDAPARIEGVVLIDELDLHLHPRWQRVALASLRETFPRLQFIVSTHSPQVLSSAENRQVRLLMDGKLWEREVFVAGRDTNAIIREYFETDDRDEKGTVLLEELDDAIDAKRGDDARRLFAVLLEKWGQLDPSLIRRKSRIERLE